ncbi:MAG TPA: murein L,D-transpeptidase catalytic domain family protein [Anditalea sp.]|nr:murein L,D-transpeptidase catalytic domain family protein [Anditalea sp.]
MIKALTLITLLIATPVFSSNSYDTFDKDVEVSISAEDALVQLVSTNPLNELFVLPNDNLLEMAVNGYHKLLNNKQIEKGKTLTIVDFSLPSTEKRMWIIDVESGMILHNSVVSHGRNSGNLMAEKFSNVDSSYMSSLGFYVTGETYFGKHGYSLRLDGVEKGFNDKARDRAIVIHGAEYANENFITSTGRLGRSLGCPALPVDTSKEIIDMIKDKTCLFIFGKDDDYISKSKLINRA